MTTPSIVRQLHASLATLDPNHAPSDLIAGLVLGDVLVALVGLELLHPELDPLLLGVQLEHDSFDPLVLLLAVLAIVSGPRP